MAPSEHDNTEDLERRLREAFSAKALQISDADLDRDREAEVIAALHDQERKHPAARWFAGIGSAAAAAAIIGVAFVGLHDSGQQQVIDGLPPALTSSSSAAPSGSSSTTTSTQSSSTSSWPSASTSSSPTRPNRVPSTQSSTATTYPSDSTSSSSDSSDSSESSDQDRTMASDNSSSAATPGQNGATGPSMKLATRQPPALPGGLPQAGALGDQEYAGAVPLDDPSGGGKRELAMPSGVKWQRTAQGSNSLTVRITDLPTDIEAYWRQTLPGQGWVADGGGWTFPDTGYTVSPITDKGSFTVTW